MKERKVITLFLVLEKIITNMPKKNIATNIRQMEIYNSMQKKKKIEQSKLDKSGNSTHKAKARCSSPFAIPTFLW